MDTAGTIKPVTGKQRRTRSAVSMKPHDHAETPDGTSEKASSRSRSRPPTPMLVVLLGLVTRLLSARVPQMMSQAKEKLTEFFHAKEDDDGPSVQERLADTGNRVVAWGRKNPGQAIAVGAAVLTAVVLVGTMVHRAQAQAGGPSSAWGAKRRKKSGKSG